MGVSGRQPYEEQVDEQLAYRLVRLFKNAWSEWQLRLPRPGYAWQLAEHVRLVNRHGRFYLSGHRHIIDRAFKNLSLFERNLVEGD